MSLPLCYKVFRPGRLSLSEKCKKQNKTKQKEKQRNVKLINNYVEINAISFMGDFFVIN